MEKNLPIKLFKKRDNDKALNNLAPISENIGQKFRLKDAPLMTRASQLKKFFNQVDRRVKEKAKNDVYLPTVVKLKLNEDATAKSYRGEINKVFSPSRKVNIIGMLGANELLLKIDDSRDLQFIQDKLNEPEKNTIGISAVEQTVQFTPSIDIDTKSKLDLKVKLINYGDFKLNEIAERSFENYCRSKKIEFKKLNYSKDLILYRIPALKQMSLAEANDIEGIFSITNIPKMEITKPEMIDEGEILVKSPEANKEYYKIGVFDDGISDIDHLKQWKDGTFMKFELDEFDQTHGTFVAGIINYGDELEGKTWTGTRPFKLTNAVVLPNEKFGYIDEAMMVDFMREAIKQHPGVKVWNFSIGSTKAINDGQYSDFAKSLDDLQDEFNVLIVKAAGNCKNFLKAAPRGRITEASESIRTLVVGSLAHDKRSHDIAAYNHPSPFTMIGPGCSNVIKPDLVHYGGNVGMKDGTPDINGMKSFSLDGKLHRAVGTSYSAPRVAALAAELAGSIKEEFDANLIKALLIHSARHPEEFDADLQDRIDHIGFGMPSKVTDILFNDPDEVTLILRDAVDKGSNIKIMDFPYPTSMVDGGRFYGQVKITLVTSPEINPYQGAEYVQTDVDVAFGTYDKKIKVSGSKIKRNPIDMEDRQNLLRPTIYSTMKQKSATSAFKSERFLQGYSQGHQELFVPIKKWCIDLDEIRETPQKTMLGSQRQWFLQIEAAYRSNYDVRMKDAKDVAQEFVLIVTIKDPRRKGVVYNEVSRQLTQFNFLHENIKVDEHILVRNR